MVFLEDVVLYCIHVEDDFFQCIKIRDPTRMYDTLYSMVIVFKTFNLKCPHLWVHWYPNVDPYPPSFIDVETELAWEMRAVATAWRDQRATKDALALHGSVDIVSVTAKYRIVLSGHIRSMERFPVSFDHSSVRFFGCGVLPRVESHSFKLLGGQTLFRLRNQIKLPHSSLVLPQQARVSGYTLDLKRLSLIKPDLARMFHMQLGSKHMHRVSVSWKRPCARAPCVPHACLGLVEYNRQRLLFGNNWAVFKYVQIYSNACWWSVRIICYPILIGESQNQLSEFLLTNPFLKGRHFRVWTLVKLKCGVSIQLLFANITLFCRLAWRRTTNIVDASATFGPVDLGHVFLGTPLWSSQFSLSWKGFPVIFTVCPAQNIWILYPVMNFSIEQWLHLQQAYHDIMSGNASHLSLIVGSEHVNCGEQLR